MGRVTAAGNRHCLPGNTRATGTRTPTLGSRPELSGCVCSGCRQLGYASTAGTSLSEGDAQIYFQVVRTRLCLDVFGFLVLSQNTCKFLFLLRAGRNWLLCTAQSWLSTKPNAVFLLCYLAALCLCKTLF